MSKFKSFHDFVSEDKKPRVVAKTFKDANKANDFYLDLCDKYDSVKLVRSPRFSEDGEYAWEVSESARVDEARYTYEPKNFYAARDWSVDMATDADKAAYKTGYARAKTKLAELIATLEGLPRVDQMEDIPYIIKELRQVRDRFS